MYPVNSDYSIAFRHVDEFVDYWCDQVVKKSGGEWNFDIAAKVMSVIISSR